MQVRLLTSIRDILEAEADGQLATAKLIENMCADEELGWQQANNGKRIDEYWLRENLRGLIDPSGSQRWHEGKGSARVDVRGYQLHQFKDAFLRYLSSLLRGGGAASATSAPTDPAPPESIETADFAGADAGADVPHHPPPENPRPSAGEGAPEADGRMGRISHPLP